MNLVKWVLPVFLITLTIACCKKDVPQPPPSDQEELGLIADSVFLFSKEVYYWNDRLPAYAQFNPRQFIGKDALETAENTLAAIRLSNPIDNSKGFSYAEKYYDADGAKAANPEESYGFFVKAGRERQTSITSSNDVFKGWFVTYVFPNSDAGAKGVTRGMQLIKINNSILGNNNPSINLINNLFFDQSLANANLAFLKPNGDTLQGNFQIKTYQPKSLLYSSIVTTNNGQKAGYLVLKFFDTKPLAQMELDPIFQQFKTAGIKNIILDMRYNNGGFTASQDYIADNLGPKSANGKKMYTAYFNNVLRSGQFSLMKTRNYSSDIFSIEHNTEYFNTENSLDPQKIFIIIGEGTASSSELLINDLKPYFGNNLKLIGDNSTVGKPYGFFPIDLFKKVTLWPVSFLTRNGVDDSVSIEGIKPNYSVYDGVDKIWGDTTEESLNMALRLIDNPAATVPPPSQVNTQKTTNRQATPFNRLTIKIKPSYYDRMIGSPSMNKNKMR